MRTLQDAVVQCWLAFIGLPTITRIVAHLRHQQPVPVPAPAPSQPRPALTPSQPEPTAIEELTEDEPYQQPEEPEELEDTFAAWDTDRAERLQEAVECEQKGLRLLAKATLLRVAIQCDDRGETFHAEELRERAEILDTHNVDALSAEEVWQPAGYQTDDAPWGA
jgi:hypothetical protein